MSNIFLLGPVGPSFTELPIFSSRVAAGFPSPASDHLDKTVSLDDLLHIRSPGTYLVRAQGHSMIGAGIFDGDVLIVSKALDAVYGDVVIASVCGETFVKRFTIQGEHVVLCSENPKYPPRYVMEGEEFSIWGVVTASIRNHQRR